MACIGGSYSPEAEPSSGYTPLPAGEYALEIVESDYLPNSKGTGMILKCKAQIVGGEFDLRPYYINYSLEHTDEQAQEIGQRDFAGLRRATGVLAPEKSEELHWIPFRVKIAAQISKRTGDPVNRIKQYLFDDQAPAPKPRTKVKRTEWRKVA